MHNPLLYCRDNSESGSFFPLHIYPRQVEVITLKVSQPCVTLEM